MLKPEIQLERKKGKKRYLESSQNNLNSGIAREARIDG